MPYKRRGYRGLCSVIRVPWVAMSAKGRTRVERRVVFVLILVSLVTGEERLYIYTLVDPF